jgi:N-acetylglucosamine-6-phosphate deacetylase
VGRRDVHHVDGRHGAAMTTRRLGVAAAHVDGAIVPGDVALSGSSIAAVGLTPAGRSGLAVAGFVDLQVNGCAGVDFTQADVDSYATSCAALARHGVTSFLATLPTSSPDRYGPALEAAAAVTAAPPPGARLLGVHLEGPFLSPVRRGAHRAEWLAAVDEDRVRTLVDGTGVAMVTLAPEIGGGLAAVADLHRRGIVVCVGHSDAEAATAHRAFDAGAAAITHVWNAHRPLTARDPGPAGVALARPDVAVCVIADLVHVAPEVLRFTAEAARGRLVAVSDALAPAAGGDDEDHTTPPGGNGVEHTTLAGAATVTGDAPGPVTRPPGDHHLRVRDGAVRLPDGALAGASCLLDAGLANLVSVGVPLDEALDAVSAAPARLLGRSEVGRLTVGGPADVVVLDDDLSARHVLVGGASMS